MGKWPACHLMSLSPPLSPTTFSPANPHTHTPHPLRHSFLSLSYGKGVEGNSSAHEAISTQQRNNKLSQTNQSHPVHPDAWFKQNLLWCNQTGKTFSVELEFRANSAILPGTVRLTSYQKNYWRKIKGGEPSPCFTFVGLHLFPLHVGSLMLLLCSCVHVSKHLSWL